MKKQDELQPHIKCKVGDVADSVLLVGDPDRIALVTKYWDSARLVANNRGLPVWTGKYKGIPISIASTGMGCPSAAIVFEELANIGAKYFIRIGTCGGLIKKIRPGDLIVPTGAIRAEGTTKEYIDESYPAIADAELVSALSSAATAGKYTFWKGINRTHDAFYEPVENLIRWGRLFEDERMKKWNPPVSSEMECSVIFVLAGLRGLKSAAVLSVNTVEPLDVIAKDPMLVYKLIESEEAKKGVDRAIRTALSAVVIYNKNLKK